jgi:hypothetical protein
MCGVYSVLNAIQLVLYPQRLKKAELQRLYRHALGYLSGRRQLQRVLGIGMGYDVWTELRDELITYINGTYGLSLKPTRTLSRSAARDRRRAIEHIKKSLRRGRPVLTLLGGTLDHYSVFCGYTDQRLILFDSDRLRWVKADNVGLGERSRRTHWILPEYTSTLCEEW